MSTSTHHLPAFLVIAPAGLEFTDKPNNIDDDRYIRLIVKGHAVPSPTVEALKEYKMYTNDDSMSKQMPFNAYVNPYMDMKALRVVSRLAGPFGIYVLHNKGGLDFDVLKKAVSDYESLHGGNSHMPELVNAVQQWFEDWC